MLRPMWGAAACIAILLYSQVGAATPRLGAIRWDAWIGRNTTVGLAVTEELDPQRWHYRLPFFGAIIGPNNVTVNGSSSAVMHQELQYARQFGIDWWAFVTYPSDDPMTGILDNYLNISNPGVNMALIVEAGRLGTEIPIDRIIQYMRRPRYEAIQVDNGNPRPVFIILSPTESLAPVVKQLRAAAAAASLGNPYVVVMSGHGVGAQENMRVQIGADGLGRYMYLSQQWADKPGTAFPFASNAAGEQAYWKQVSALGTCSGEHHARSEHIRSHVPCAGCRPYALQSNASIGKLLAPLTAGWDPRPREILPVPWGQSFPSGCKGDTLCWVEDPTMQELAKQAASAACFLRSNPEQPQVALVSAWNEIDEGHWVLPSLAHGTQKLEALQMGFRASDPCSMAWTYGT